MHCMCRSHTSSVASGCLMHACTAGAASCPPGRLAYTAYCPVSFMCCLPWLHTLRATPVMYIHMYIYHRWRHDHEPTKGVTCQCSAATGLPKLWYTTGVACVRSAVVQTMPYWYMEVWLPRHDRQCSFVLQQLPRGCQNGVCGVNLSISLRL